jgi:hypothetical protein
VTGIVEAGDRKAAGGTELIERHCLAAGHIGAIATEPADTGGHPLALQDGDIAPRLAIAHA